MGTKVYGCSDDLVEFEGEFRGEVGCYGTDDTEQGVLVSVSDGTILEVKYGKLGKGIWGITVIQKGDLLEGLEPCTNEEAEVYSDIAHFGDGIKWAYAAMPGWEAVK